MPAPCLAKTSSITLTQAAGGQLQADVNLSLLPGNELSTQTDGLYSPNPPTAGVQLASAQTVPSAQSTTTFIAFDTALWNPLGLWVSTSPTRLTVARAGLYTIGAAIYTTATQPASSYFANARIYKNGAPIDFGAAPGAFAANPTNSLGTPTITVPDRNGGLTVLYTAGSTGTNTVSGAVWNLATYLQVGDFISVGITTGTGSGYTIAVNGDTTIALPRSAMQIAYHGA